MAFIRKNFLLIIVCIFLFFTGVEVSFKFQKDMNSYKRNYIELHKECLETGEYILCQHYGEDYKKLDTINSFGYMLFSYDATSRLQLLFPLFIIILSVYSFSKYLRGGVLKNSILRIQYRKFIIRKYINTLKYAIIPPLFLLLLFICAYIISGNFDYKYGIYSFGYNAFGTYNAEHLILFLFVYFFNFFLRGIFWINIGIYNCKYNKNKFVASMISYIEYIMIFLILETGIGETIFYKRPMMYYLLLTNVWVFSKVSLCGMTLMSLTLVLISSVFVFFAYKNKEDVLVEVEK